MASMMKPTPLSIDTIAFTSIFHNSIQCTKSTRDFESLNRQKVTECDNQPVFLFLILLLNSNAIYEIKPKTCFAFDCYEDEVFYSAFIVSSN